MTYSHGLPRLLAERACYTAPRASSLPLESFNSRSGVTGWAGAAGERKLAVPGRKAWLCTQWSHIPFDLETVVFLPLNLGFL